MGINFAKVTSIATTTMTLAAPIRIGATPLLLR
jgi:hypothetical protein